MRKSPRHNMQLLVIIGVRPQYIKAAALQEIIVQYNEGAQVMIDVTFLDTAQHYSPRLLPNHLTSDSYPPILRLTHHSKDPFEIFLGSIEGVGQYVKRERSSLDGVIVIGDANPTAIGAIVGAKAGLPVIHLEAGARRDPREEEEKNRQIADALSVLRLCVTQQATHFLDSSGYDGQSLWTGDFWYEYLMNTVQQIGEIRQEARGKVLVTIHRPHNLDNDTLYSLVEALDRNERQTQWIVHPRCEKLVKTLCARKTHIEICQPMSYKNMIEALMRSAYVLTDSGGLIREAHHLERRVLVRRDIGGWEELMATGLNRRLGRGIEEVGSGLEWAEETWHLEYPAGSPMRRKGGVRIGMDAILSLVG